MLREWFRSIISIALKCDGGEKAKGGKDVRLVFVERREKGLLRGPELIAMSEEVMAKLVECSHMTIEAPFRYAH